VSNPQVTAGSVLAGHAAGTSLPGNLIVTAHLVGVRSGSLRVGESGGGENLLDHRVLPVAVIVDVRGGGPDSPLASRVCKTWIRRHK
jgi:hypothetical protein